MREASIKDLPNVPLLDVQEALASVRPEWERLSDNHQLSKHLVGVQDMLNSCKAPICPERGLEIEESRRWYQLVKCADVRPSIHALLRQPLKALPTNEDSVVDHVNGGDQGTRTIAKLSQIFVDGKFSKVPPRPNIKFQKQVVSRESIRSQECHLPCAREWNIAFRAVVLERPDTDVVNLRTD